jgi:hypothetical protein
MRVGQWLKQHCIYDAKDCGVRTDADGQGENGHDREPGGLRDLPEGEFQVGDHKTLEIGDCAFAEPRISPMRLERPFSLIPDPQTLCCADDPFDSSFRYENTALPGLLRQIAGHPLGDVKEAFERDIEP